MISIRIHEWSEGCWIAEAVDSEQPDAPRLRYEGARHPAAALRGLVKRHATRAIFEALAEGRARIERPPMLVCAQCNSPEVQTVAWINANTEEVFDDFGSAGEYDTTFCPCCEENGVDTVEPEHTQTGPGVSFDECKTCGGFHLPKNHEGESLLPVGSKAS